MAAEYDALFRCAGVVVLRDVIGWRWGSRQRHKMPVKGRRTVVPLGCRRDLHGWGIGVGLRSLWNECSCLMRS